MTFCTDFIPDNLIQKDRTVDENFESDEVLFIRCLSDFIDSENKKLLTVGFPSVPRTSVNRGKYCEKEDVLVPIYLDWGIAQFQVSHVTRIDTPIPDTPCLVEPKHVPLPANYPHAEIRVFQDDIEHTEITEVKDNSLGKKIKKYIRAELNRNATIEAEAALSLAEWQQVRHDRNKIKEELERVAVEAA